MMAAGTKMLGSIICKLSEIHHTKLCIKTTYHLNNIGQEISTLWTIYFVFCFNYLLELLSVLSSSVVALSKLDVCSCIVVSLMESCVLEEDIPGDRYCVVPSGSSETVVYSDTPERVEQL